MNNQNLFLVVFDISDNKRRRKLTKFLKGSGIRVQRSVFECRGDKRLEKELHKFLEGFYEAGDNIRMYRLNSDKEVNIFGDGLEEHLENYYIF